MSSHNYDVLRQTWIYQEIQLQIQTEEAQRQHETDRQTLIAIVQARFPRLLSYTQQTIEASTHTDILRHLIVQIGSARTEKEVRQHLLQHQQAVTEQSEQKSLTSTEIS